MEKMIRWYFILLLSSFVASSTSESIPNCTDRGETICIGHNSRKALANGVTIFEILQDAYTQFCGCRYIRGNVNIQSFNNMSVTLTEDDFSFLYYIKEISGYLTLQIVSYVPRLSLPNLRLIRGSGSLSSTLGNALVLNGNIELIHMPLLTEITIGNVLIHGLASNPNSLCNTRSVNWTDITSSNTSTISITVSDQCDTIDCTALGCSSGYCWCNDSISCCQTLTQCRGICENRCRIFSGGAIQCCHSECAAGCSGGRDDQCHACKRVLDDGTCRNGCPERRIFDSNTNTIIQNPDFKFEATPLCVTRCPDVLFEVDDLCLEQCPVNYMSVTTNGTMRCINCNGTCPLECSAETAFVDDFTGCTILVGSLRIGQASGRSAQLNALRTIEEIRGSLTIELYDEPTFPFLSNLKVIGSDPSKVLSFPCGDNSTESSKYSVVIDNTKLRSIDLSSLERIDGGGIRLNDNNDLCYIGNLSYYLTNSSASVCLLNNYTRSREECIFDNFTCHPQCVSDKGWCWGPNDTQCVTCSNFLYEGQCVPVCNNFTTFGIHLHGMNDDRICRPCHSFCNGSCSGEGPDQCHECNTDFFVNVSTGQGFQCLQKCITDTYLPHNRQTGECLPCFDGCTPSYGCAGPGMTFNTSNGCINCSTVLLNHNGEQIRCQRDKINCPDGFYREMLTSDLGIFTAGTVLCRSCHELCGTCTRGPRIEDCNTCRFVRSSNLSCAYYCDPNTEIQPLNNSNQCMLISTDAALVAGSIAGAVLLICVIIAVIVVILCIVRAMHSSKYRHNAIFDSPEDLELFTLGKETIQPPKMAPNAARLIIAPEDELEFGKELGSGAFGTVYEGFWQPQADHNKYRVAIKVLKNASSNASTELLQEGVVMASMDHENVVRLYCVCMSKQLMLISQFVPLGALLDYIKNHKERMSAYTILLFSSQIAKGMAYLESKHLVHRDLAARNVLVQTPVKVKITDFGLTRIVESDQIHYEASTSKMPVRWLPPESIRQRVFNHKTDVWSFGVTVWEMLTFGARPYQGKKPYEILKMLEAGHRLEQPVTCTLDLYAVLLQCWLLEPDSRPTFENLILRFQEMLSDPSRYVLTLDPSDYGLLPSNVYQEGENAYEQPFTNETLPSDASIPGAFTVAAHSSIDPYSNLAEAGYEFPSANGKVPAARKNTRDYEVPVEKLSPNDANPRYVDFSDVRTSGIPHSYDYIDEDKMMAGNLLVPPVSSYEVPVNDNLNTNYEFPENPGRLGSPLHNSVSVQDGNYEFPEDPNNVEIPSSDGFINMTYDSRAGVSPNPQYKTTTESPEHSYEDPMDGSDTLPNVNKQENRPLLKSNDYEESHDVPSLRESFMNMTYDSRAGVSPNPQYKTTTESPEHSYEDPMDGSDTLPNVNKQENRPLLKSNDYEEPHDIPSLRESFVNMTYDSRAGVAAKNISDDNYETPHEKEPLLEGFSNLMYDSRAGVSKHIAPIDNSNYEIPDEPNYEIPDEPNYETPDEPFPNINRTVSPYEVPVKDGDYEEPFDGIPQYNVYDAPL